jgi:hypothetical protein
MKRVFIERLGIIVVPLPVMYNRTNHLASIFCGLSVVCILPAFNKITSRALPDEQVKFTPRSELLKYHEFTLHS